MFKLACHIFTGVPKRRKKTAIKIKSRIKKTFAAYFFRSVFFVCLPLPHLIVPSSHSLFIPWNLEWFFIVCNSSRLWVFLSSSKPYHHWFACVINTLWLATNISSVWWIFCPSSSSLRFFIRMLNLIDGCLVPINNLFKYFSSFFRSLLVYLLHAFLLPNLSVCWILFTAESDFAFQRNRKQK